MAQADQEAGLRANPLLGWFFLANATLAVAAIGAWWAMEAGLATSVAIAWISLLVIGMVLNGRRALWALLFAPVILFLPAMLILLEATCRPGGCDF